ncbi:MAG: hypothetical protein SGPRY_000080 [Prymnesium sp.]
MAPHSRSPARRSARLERSSQALARPYPLGEQLDERGLLTRRLLSDGTLLTPPQTAARLPLLQRLSERRPARTRRRYPHSVRAEYLRFQMFDTIQGASSYLRGILTTSALLRGAGVGEEAASPMAAAIAWVLRDGFGMFGSLLFSYAFGSGFDRNVKEWRLFADLINDVGLTLDMLAPLMPSPSSFALLAAAGAACKSICGTVAGACRSSVTAHFALSSNLADVSAKEGAQETAVTLVGLVVGSWLATQLGDSQAISSRHTCLSRSDCCLPATQLTCWLAFILLTALHVWANVLGVGCLQLTTLNAQRAVLLSISWWGADDKKRATCLTPQHIATLERPWGPLVRFLTGPRLGVSLSTLVGEGNLEAAAIWKDLAQLYHGESYLIRMSPNGRAHIALTSSATGCEPSASILRFWKPTTSSVLRETLLKALFHCEILTHNRETIPSANLNIGMGANEKVSKNPNSQYYCIPPPHNA